MAEEGAAAVTPSEGSFLEERTRRKFQQWEIDLNFHGDSFIEFADCMMDFFNCRNSIQLFVHQS